MHDALRHPPSTIHVQKQKYRGFLDIAGGGEKGGGGGERKKVEGLAMNVKYIGVSPPSELIFLK